MSRPRKVRLMGRPSASEPLQTRVFASESQAKRFMRWQLPAGVVATLEPIESKKVEPQTMSARTSSMPRAAPRRPGGCLSNMRSVETGRRLAGLDLGHVLLEG